MFSMATEKNAFKTAEHDKNMSQLNEREQSLSNVTFEYIE